nr:MAG TPA: hypothetical protein [Caudoviricetes sp.]
MKQGSYTYMAVFHKEKDGYSVCFPQLDGCLTEGDDFQSALRMAQEAMSLHLYGMEQDGEEIPEPVLEPMEVAPGEMLVPVTVWMTPFWEAQENRAAK